MPPDPDNSMSQAPTPVVTIAARPQTQRHTARQRLRSATRDSEAPMTSRPLTIAATFLVACVGFVLSGLTMQAASHSDAPLIKQDPQANLTDVYAFVGTKYNDPKREGAERHCPRAPVLGARRRRDLRPVRR